MSISVRWVLSGSALLGLLGLLTPAARSAEEPSKHGVFVGTYTGSGSEGIYRFEFDSANGDVTPAELVAKTANPSFLALHPSKPFLYAVNEVDTFEGKPGGAVSAFTVVGKKGRLTPLNFESAKGGGTCHLIVDKGGKNVIASNYGGGSVAVLPILPDGNLGPASAFVQHKGTGGDPSRQTGPHAHSTTLDAANAYAFVADLGLDKIMIYKYDPIVGSLTPNKPPAARTAPAEIPSADPISSVDHPSTAESRMAVRSGAVSRASRARRSTNRSIVAASIPTGTGGAGRSRSSRASRRNRSRAIRRAATSSQPIAG